MNSLAVVKRPGHAIVAPDQPLQTVIRDGLRDLHVAFAGNERLAEETAVARLRLYAEALTGKPVAIAAHAVRSMVFNNPRNPWPPTPQDMRKRVNDIECRLSLRVPKIALALCDDHDETDAIDIPNAIKQAWTRDYLAVFYLRDLEDVAAGRSRFDRTPGFSSMQFVGRISDLSDEWLPAGFREVLSAALIMRRSELRTLLTTEIRRRDAGKGILSDVLIAQLKREPEEIAA